MKACRTCKTRFKSPRPFVTWCSDECGQVQALAKLEKAKAKRAACDRRETKARLEVLKTVSEWEKEAEREVNRYVRLRDFYKGCISCEKPATWGGQWHASHFRSVGAASAVRFHLWNIHKACSQCNKWRAGNLAVYAPRLRALIGGEKVDWLYTQNQIARYSVAYLKRLKAVFRKKANRLERRLGL